MGGVGCQDPTPGGRCLPRPGLRGGGGGGAARMCTAGAPRPPHTAGTWAAARWRLQTSSFLAGLSRAGSALGLSVRAVRRPWPCAACWCSFCAAAGGCWPWSPRNPEPAVRAAACASEPPCAACICYWRPCPPWRPKPPSCECCRRGEGGASAFGASREVLEGYGCWKR